MVRFRRRRNIKLVGITGGIGSGKTTVARFFKNLGGKVIDADNIGHRALLKKEIKKSIISCFGKGILKNNRIDRAMLAKIVFNSRKKLSKLCFITHPYILRKIREILKTSKKRIVIIDAPLLIESGFHKKMDKVIVVKINKGNQLNRCKRMGFSKKEVLKRMRVQLPLRQKIRHADYLIDNNGSRLQTKRQVLKVWKSLAP